MGRALLMVFDFCHQFAVQDLEWVGKVLLAGAMLATYSKQEGVSDAFRKAAIQNSHGVDSIPAFSKSGALVRGLRTSTRRSLMLPKAEKL